MRVCLILLGLMLTAVAFGDDERLARLSPPAVQRGGERTIQITGANIGDAEEILFYDSLSAPDGADRKGTAIEVVSIERAQERHPKNEKDENGQFKMVPSDKRLNVVLNVPSDCPLGKHRLRLRTRTGQSELRNLLVVDLPVQSETNKGTPSDPEMIAAEAFGPDGGRGIVMTGRIDREDVDCFGVDLKAGDRLTAEVHGTRLGYSSGNNYFDPYLAIVDEAGFEIAVCDDHPQTGNDAFVSLTVPEDGRYVVHLRDAAYNGDGNAFYALHIGPMLRPVVAHPPGGQFGQTLDVTFEIANATKAADGEIETVTRSVTLPTEEQMAAATHPYGYLLESDGHFAPAAVPMIVSAAHAIAEAEPNNTPNKNATPIELTDGRVAVHGVIDTPGDLDCFRLALKKNQTVQVAIHASAVGSPLDPVLAVHQLTPKYKYDKGADDTGRHFDSTLTYRAPETGEYSFRVKDHLDRSGPAFAYRMEIGPPERRIESEPVEFNRYVQERFTVPQGGGFGFQATAVRRGFGGEVTIDGVDLPEGVTVVSPESWQSKGRVPVVLYAEPDAPLAGSLATLRLTHQPTDKDGKPSGEPVVASMTQRHLMVRWRNNDRVLEETLERMPVVVREALPFTVAIEPPEVPIVPGAYLPLTVRAERNEGFDGEIRVIMLQDPGGCSSSRSAKIAKGQDSVTFNLTASDKAEIGTWDIAMRAWTGSSFTCSPFVPVTVAPKSVSFQWKQAAAEQGTDTAVVATIEQLEDWTGTAEVTLMGLPPHCATEPQTITPDQTEIVFPVSVGTETPAGTHKSLYAIVKVPHGEIEYETKPAESVAVASAEPAAELSAESTGDEQEPSEDKPEEKPTEEPTKKPADESGDAAKDGTAGESPAEAQPAEPKTIQVEKPRPTVLHQLRGGVLRVDKPLPKKPAKTDEKKAEKKAEKKPEPKKPAAPKPLSRLEQLRKAKADAK